MHASSSNVVHSFFFLFKRNTRKDGSDVIQDELAFQRIEHEKDGSPVVFVSLKLCYYLALSLSMLIVSCYQLAMLNQNVDESNRLVFMCKMCCACCLVCVCRAMDLILANWSCTVVAMVMDVILVVLPENLFDGWVVCAWVA